MSEYAHKGGEDRVYTKVNTETAKSMMEADPLAVAIDVRTEEEYEAGHVPRSISIPLGEIPLRVGQAVQNRETKIFVYCGSGFRSKIASLTLMKMGYKNVIDMGSIQNWRYPLEQ
jgi:rhodanese-related sulfurtransferase